MAMCWITSCCITLCLTNKSVCVGAVSRHEAVVALRHFSECQHVSFVGEPVFPNLRNALEIGATAFRLFVPHVICCKGCEYKVLQCAKHPSVTTKEGPPSTLASEPSCPPGCLPLIKTFVCTCEAKWFAAVVTFWPYYPANLCRDFPRSPLRQMLSQNIAVTFHLHNAAACTGTALTSGKNFNGCLDLIVLLVLCCHEPMQGRGEGFTLWNRTRVNESHTRMWGELRARDSETQRGAGVGQK